MRSLIPVLSTLTLLFGVPGAGVFADEAIQSDPLAPVADSAEQETLFERIDPEDSGINFVPDANLPYEHALRLNSYTPSAGVAIGDYDMDGLPDVYISGCASGGKLYKNLGDFKFEDVTEKAGIVFEDFWGNGVTFADVNNDGKLDLYLCAFLVPNRLYINQGDGTFVEKAKEYGLDCVGANTMMSFMDIDRDGDLDGYLVTNDRNEVGTKFSGSGHLIDGKPVLPPKYREEFDVFHFKNGSFRVIRAAQYDHLYRNDGGSGFIDISEEAGLSTQGWHGLSASWLDYDADGWPDVYVSNDFYGPDHLYQHNGDPSAPAFEDQAHRDVPHTPWFSMGTDVGDINNDGFIDLMGADMSASSHFRSKVEMGDMSSKAWFLDNADPPQYMRNMLLVNTGRGSFLEAAQMAGVDSTNWTWSVRMSDFDCDGRVDIFVTTGMTRDFMHADLSAERSRLESVYYKTDEDFPTYKQKVAEFWEDKQLLKQRNIAFQNLGDLKFKKVGAAWGLDEYSVGFGAATGDLDGDGDADLVVNNYEGEPSLYRNHAGAAAPEASNRIKIRLVGARSNSHGIGATVRLETPSGTHMRYVSLARGYMSSSEPLAFFGLGEESHITSLSVEWPSGNQQRFTDLETNRLYTITEQDAEPQATEKTDDTPLLVEREVFSDIQHSEKIYNDFLDQPLLPNKLSQLGPGMAWGDVNGDGRDEVYLGGAAGQPGRLLTFTSETARVMQSFEEQEFCEDMGAVFLDVDGDGDNDLYVVSGGVEAAQESALYQDRLYLNDGSGNLTLTKGALPELLDSGGQVVAVDYDRDGDLDLFIGGRVLPGEYPATPKSRLLRNESASGESVRFVDATEEDATGLLDAGMITGALWSDTDNDGWNDLLLTCEWGPVKVFRNHEGKLVEETDAAGLSDRLGWFNSITGGDVDGDGDTDYVVTNFGRNTKYHASSKDPVHIYYGDFDDTGSKTIVEAKNKKGKLLPVRGKSCSQKAMPFLENKFPTYESFAFQDLVGIYTQDCLAEATQLTINEMDSGVLINDGKGGFTFKAFPPLAQIAPGFGTVLLDVNADGALDVVMVQNFFGPQRETGRFNGGVGIVMLGDGTGGFTTAWPNESGFEIRGDATALTLADLDDDGTPELCAAVNDGAPRVFAHNQAASTSNYVEIKLKGSKGNPTSVGSRVTCRFDDGHEQTAEVYAGHGYLSQSTAKLYIAVPEGRKLESVEVRWDDGTVTQHQASGKEPLILKRS